MPRPLYVDEQFQRINKKVFKRLQKDAQGKRFYGSTATGAKEFDKLSGELERMETSLEIFADSAITLQGTSVMSPNSIVANATNALRILKKLNVAGLPQSSIDELQGKLDSFTNYDEILATAEAEADNASNQQGVPDEQLMDRYLSARTALQNVIQALKVKIALYESGAVSRSAPLASEPSPSSRTFEGGSLYHHPMFQNKKYVIPFTHAHYYPANYPFPRYLA